MQKKESNPERWQAMRPCAGADEAGARSRARPGEAAFYDALTREEGEPPRMGK